MLKLKKGYLDAKVIVEIECPVCQGRGIIGEPGWELYWKEFGEEGTKRTNEQDFEWFSEHGYSRIPSEEVGCSDCDATGVIKQLVKLADLFEDEAEMFRMELVDVLNLGAVRWDLDGGAE